MNYGNQQQQFGIMILYYENAIHKWIENMKKEKKCFANDTQ